MANLAQLAVVVALVVAEPVLPGARDEASRIADEERWLLAESTRMLSQVGFDSTHPGSSRAEKITLPDSLLTELRPVFETLAMNEPSGVAPTQPSREVPRPWWDLYRLDIDADGTSEILVTGGVDPRRFYAVLERSKQVWRILHQSAYELLGARKYGKHLYLFGGFDGYGVANPVLVVDRISLGRPTHEAPEPLLRFELLAEALDDVTEAVSPRVCTVNRASRLRSTPRVEDSPMDRGLGIDFPGNVVQTLAPGSRGWALGRAVATDGNEWLLCCFAGEVPWHGPEPVPDGVLLPKTRVTKSVLEPQTLIVGWMAERDLSR